jgi:hypothetical protein
VTSFDTTSIPSITPQQWQRLRDLLYLDQFKTVEVPWLCSATGMHFRDASTLMRALVAQGSARWEWQLFHDCSEHPVEIFAEPMAPDDWVCPECEVGSYPRRWEARAVLLETVVFV